MAFKRLVSISTLSMLSRSSSTPEGTPSWQRLQIVSGIAQRSSA
jgi:hypothetical protein